MASSFTAPHPCHFSSTIKSFHAKPHSLKPFSNSSFPFFHSSTLHHLSLSSNGTGCAHFGSDMKGGVSFGQTGAVRELVGSVTDVGGLRFAIVVARFNEIVTKPLLEGALSTFRSYSVKEDIDVVWVPGSYELGVVAQQLGKSGKYHTIVCIGAVIRGDTSHYDAVANSAASGVLSAGINSGVPCVFGVLTCDDMDRVVYCIFQSH